MLVGSSFDNVIKDLEQRKTYMYLGIDEVCDIEHKNEKEKLRNENLRRLRLVFGTELSANNKIQGIVSLPVPILIYEMWQ